MTELTKRPFALVGIDHLVFLVDDLDRATKWGTDVLGCQPGLAAGTNRPSTLSSPRKTTQARANRSVR